jgi:uncharacterized protein YheU (UPF0270 family)
MKVALVKYYNREKTHYTGDYGDDELTLSNPVFQEFSDWEEISDEELNTLRQFVARENTKHNPYSTSRYMLVLESDIPIKTAIKEQLVWIKTEEIKAKEAVAKAKKDAEDKKAKALLKKQKLSEEKEKALLETLKQKYESSDSSKSG